MRREDIMFLLGLAAFFLTTAVCKINAEAFSKPVHLNAVGSIEMDKDGSGIAGDHPSDVVIDAEDIYYLYELCR